jgi:hypothetical protein
VGGKKPPPIFLFLGRAIQKKFHTPEEMGLAPSFIWEDGLEGRCGRRSGTGGWTIY